MKWVNDKQAYGWVSITLHWLAALAILTMVVSGLNAEAAGEAGDRAAQRALMGVHISLGASFALLLLARVAASYVQPRPTPPQQPPALGLAASATHQLLLLAIVIQVISGPLAVWSGGRAIDVFSLFSIPGPFAERNESVHEAAEALHAVGRWMLYILVPVHVLAALKHAMIDRDGVLQRMLAAGRPA